MNLLLLNQKQSTQSHEWMNEWNVCALAQVYKYSHIWADSIPLPVEPYILFITIEIVWQMQHNDTIIMWHIWCAFYSLTARPFSVNSAADTRVENSYNVASNANCKFYYFFQTFSFEYKCANIHKITLFTKKKNKIYFGFTWAHQNYTVN